MLIHDTGFATYYLISKRKEQHDRIVLLELCFSAKLEESNGAFRVFNKIADRLWLLTRQDLEVDCQLLPTRTKDENTHLK